MTTYYLTNTSPGAPSLTGAAGSLITLLDFCLVTTMGWSKAFSGTNTASYRAATGLRHCLGVDDSTTLNARVRGFETMAAAGVAVASGTGPFPTDTQLSGGGYIYKSADTGTVRSWWFASDGRMCYLSINAVNYPALFGFGEFASYKAADSYNTLFFADTAAGGYQNGTTVISSGLSYNNGHYLARTYTQFGGSVPSGKVVDGAYGNVSNLGSSGVAYPSIIEGGLLLSRVQVADNSVGLRGRLPGLWNPCHARPLADGDTFTGTGDLAGRTFAARHCGSSGQVMVETSDTWST